MARFDVFDNEWDMCSWRHGEGTGCGGTLGFCLDWWGVHPDWLPEMERLANIHGGLTFGDDDLGLDIHHPTKPDHAPLFHVYWCVTTPRKQRQEQGSLADLLKLNKHVPTQQKLSPDLCPSCKSQNLRVLKGKAQHAAELRCLNCDRFQMAF
ncbi:hypothetical protein [Leptolyngbya sp. FACHB-17]|uniref:hypothetical protein n=1 Tax=unclassified Leptolyngbya TaxID=2650499 RepID=UPI0016814398|nr:hypothetical protein [Leptolyngbya sp. FACHB-17]MBD2078803.1 hypothetical protein [Leptolyngbya sp. FACHB-17]